MEATKCLGELGPTDSTMTLRPIINLIQEADHAVEALTYRSVSLLTTFLVKNTVELRKVLHFSIAIKISDFLSY
jgi:hypothetical protein